MPNIVIINENVFDNKKKLINNLIIRIEVEYYIILTDLFNFTSVIICRHLTDRSLPESLALCLNKVS